MRGGTDPRNLPTLERRRIHPLVLPLNYEPQRHMTTNYTPGPWVNNHTTPSTIGSTFWEITDAIDKPVAFVNEPQPRSREEMAANADLIAAAPDLLEALQGMLRVTSGQAIYAFMKPQRDAANAAVLRATGPVTVALPPRCRGCGGSIISRLCSCGTPHPEYRQNARAETPGEIS